MSLVFRYLLVLGVAALLLTPTQSMAKRAKCNPEDECRSYCKNLLLQPQYGAGRGRVKDSHCVDAQGRCCPWDDPRWRICTCVIEVEGKCVSSTNGSRVDCSTKARQLPTGGCYCSAGSTSHIPMSLGLLLLFALRLQNRRKRQR